MDSNILLKRTVKDLQEIILICNAKLESLSNNLEELKTLAEKDSKKLEKLNEFITAPFNKLLIKPKKGGLSEL